MPKKDADLPHTVTIMYGKDQDNLFFKSKTTADAAVEQLRNDVESTSQNGIIMIEDDGGKSINFRNKNFNRTICKPTSDFDER